MLRYLTLLLFSLFLVPIASNAEVVDLESFCSLRGNTYIVDRDINLRGAEVRAKDNANIKFKDGSISNGKIELSNNYLKGRVKLYSEVTGTISNRNGHVAWFGRSGDDVTSGLQVLANSCSSIIIDKGTWMVSSGVVIKSNQTIKGVSKKESIIKVDEESIAQSRAKICVFSTVEFSLPYISTENLRNKPDDFYSSKAFRNISISNITFDLNRHPSYLVDKRKTGIISLIALRLENCEKCSVSNCCFVDYQEFDFAGEDEFAKRKRSDAYAAVFVTDCNNCTVRNCESHSCTFLFIVNSNNVLVEGNTGANSFGTWIETLGGCHHKILRNHFKNQWWHVSTIGVNSVNCEVAYNTVNNNTANEISCITLGHDSRNVIFKYGMNSIADNAYVHDNNLKTSSDRGIIVQSASNVRIINNNIICSPKESTIDRAGIVLIGDVTNFKNEVIRGNKVTLKDGDGIGIIGLEIQNSIIESNTIGGTVNTGIWIKDKCYGITVNDNIINQAKYAVKIDWVDKMVFEGNEMMGGDIIARCGELLFSRNKWTGITNPFKLLEFDNHMKLIVKDNLFERGDSVTISSPFNHNGFDIAAHNKLKGGFTSLGLTNN